jgi:hypothetical protein
VCYRTSGSLVIDGRLDEPSWQDAPWTDLFMDIEGPMKPAPRFRTRAKMLWDDDYLFVGAELEEPHLRATMTERGSPLFQENDFEVFIDPDSDGADYCEIEINALNTVWDLLMPRPYHMGGRPVEQWQMNGLKTAVHIVGTINNPSDIDMGWSVELAIAWKDLTAFAHCHTPPIDGDCWRINLLRIERPYDLVHGQYVNASARPADYWAWSPQGEVNMHRPEQWGYVQFSSLQVNMVSQSHKRM